MIQADDVNKKGAISRKNAQDSDNEDVYDKQINLTSDKSMGIDKTDDINKICDNFTSNIGENEVDGNSMSGVDLDMAKQAENESTTQNMIFDSTQEGQELDEELA